MWNAATARKTNTGTRNLISAAGLLVVEGFGYHSEPCLVLSLHSLLYVQLHHMFRIDRRLWYHCPSLPGRTAAWHITTQTYPYSGGQCHPLLAPQSHGPLFGMLLCLFDLKKKKRESLHLSWKQCTFPFRTGNGDFIMHPWLMYDGSHSCSVRQLLNYSCWSKIS